MEITGFERVVCITDFNLEKKVDAHSSCHFKALVKSEDIDAMVSLVGKTTTISHNGKNLLFGIIQRVDVTTRVDASYVETDVVSVSTVIDQDAYTRVFQNEDKRLSDVVRSLELTPAKTFSSAKLGNHTVKVVDSEVSSTVLSMPVVQLDETDFQFLLRLANFLGCSLWVDDINPNTPTIYLGKNSSKKKVSIDESRVLFYKKSKCVDCTVHTVEVDEVYTLGSKVTFKDVSGTITGVVIVLSSGSTYSYCYQITESLEYPHCSYLSNSMRAYFKAKVTDNEDDRHLGRVKVTFKDDSSVDGELLSDSNPYITTLQANSKNAGGTTFIPNVDDTVHVTFYKDTLLVDYSLREDGYPDEFNVYNHRYIYNTYGKSISLNEDDIVVQSKDSTITLSDSECVAKVGDYSITVDGEQLQCVVGDSTITATNSSIELSNGSAKVVTSSDSVELSSGDTKVVVSKDSITIAVGKSKFSLSDSVEIDTKNLTTKASGNIESSGKKITLKGTNGIGLN